jgi:hypothetical protein
MAKKKSAGRKGVPVEVDKAVKRSHTGNVWERGPRNRPQSVGQNIEGVVLAGPGRVSGGYETVTSDSRSSRQARSPLGETPRGAVLLNPNEPVVDQSAAKRTSGRL